MTIRCRFVDSISATPTVRLDLNPTSGATLRLGKGGLVCPPPPLRRSESSTILTDGGEVSASVYDNRTLRVPLSFAPASLDARNTLISALVKELNRESNILEYRPDGSSTSYFFRTLRSTFDLAQWYPKIASGSIEVPVYAEPFAYGLQVTAVSAATVNNDPAAASNKQYLDLTGITGDVATPAMITIASGFTAGDSILVAVRRGGTPPQLVVQAESATILGADTTLPGNDVTMSGAGSNYARTSFATTATNARRLQLGVGAGLTVDLRGTYRVYARVRKSVAGDTITAYLTNPYFTLPAVTLASTTNRYLQDMGLVSLPSNGAGESGYSGNLLTPPAPTTFDFYAARTAGTGNLDVDYLVFVPADDALLICTPPFASQLILDGPQDGAYLYSGVGLMLNDGTIPRVGSIPSLTPGVTNRLHFLKRVGAAGSIDVIGDTLSVTVSYWPRYLVV